MFGRKKEDDGGRVKQAMISAANRALEYKKMNPRATDHEALDHVMRHADEIIHELD